MSYLTFDEFKSITGKTDDYKKTFEQFYSKAASVIDNITNRFYQMNKIDEDSVAFRVNQFKLALCSQIEYFGELGADTFESINKAPQTFSAGRTSVSNGSRYNSSGANESKSLVAEDIYIYLEGTGLLYRGVDSC
ncbi:hypothetical protein [Enterococcus malodoratus]|uniref:Protein gp8 n=1 Tax=Enterococcus malodoratus ATCC 43197 TaxID=1158601 RepID=R2NG00_9ENTE|nr:hypothetical protein [Enterococcus malodoratus]EOH71012.1 hypothetical protein UAI_04566 [Enterococcus malodoratus ATCC 43197]EOT69688.1 hypothetical protein I585_01155 [Enterococcus malodoratus ATCC 43197]OJG57410.1 hypothetical protein RV07_GL003369 [Enterococcus malodoratus]SPX01327.1 protein gp8 [Enterococcus malodoratus]STC70959.1 protein gp8 [Enterococcus malodoratus]